MSFIRTKRLENKITLSKMAKLMNMNPSNYYELENFKIDISENINSLAGILSLSESDIETIKDLNNNRNLFNRKELKVGDLPIFIPLEVDKDSLFDYLKELS